MNYKKYILIILISFLSIRNLWAESFVVDGVNMLKWINTEKKLQDAVMKTLNPNLVARCNTLGIEFVASESFGRLEKQDANVGAMMMGMLFYYRQNMLSKGMTTAAYDKFQEPYINEFRRNNYRASDATYIDCSKAVSKFLSLAAQ
jgi:hypothetical protein